MRGEMKPRHARALRKTLRQQAAMVAAQSRAIVESVQAIQAKLIEQSLSGEEAR